MHCHSKTQSKMDLDLEVQHYRILINIFSLIIFYPTHVFDKFTQVSSLGVVFFCCSIMYLCQHVYYSLKQYDLCKRLGWICGGSEGSSKSNICFNQKELTLSFLMLANVAWFLTTVSWFFSFPKITSDYLNPCFSWSFFSQPITNRKL